MTATVGNGSPSRPDTQSQEEEELAFGQVWKDAAKPQTRPKLGEIDGGRRKSSIQFHTADAEDTIRRESVTQVPKLALNQKRMSSPPPPSNYQRGVSFDTFDNRDASTESFTLRYKHRDYANSARSRTFLCGTDAKDYSEYALEWMIDELVDDGDEIVCLRVIEKETAREHNIKYREEAQKLLDSVQRKNSTEEKAISMVMELAIGKVQDIFQQMVCEHFHRGRPADSCRSQSTNPPLSSLALVAATFKVCSPCYPAPCQSIACSIRQSPSLLSVPRLSDSRRKRRDSKRLDEAYTAV
jgi:hypothetical protein